MPFCSRKTGYRIPHASNLWHCLSGVGKEWRDRGKSILQQSKDQTCHFGSHRICEGGKLLVFFCGFFWDFFGFLWSLRMWGWTESFGNQKYLPIIPLESKDGSVDGGKPSEVRSYKLLLGEWPFQSLCIHQGDPKNWSFHRSLETWHGMLGNYINFSIQGPQMAPSPWRTTCALGSSTYWSMRTSFHVSRFIWIMNLRMRDLMLTSIFSLLQFEFVGMNATNPKGPCKEVESMTILLSLAVYSAGLFQLMHVLMARHFYTEEYFPKMEQTNWNRASFLGSKHCRMEG